MFQSLKLTCSIPKIIFPYLYIQKGEKLIAAADHNFLFNPSKNRNEEDMPAQMNQRNDGHDQEKGKKKFHDVI